MTTITIERNIIVRNIITNNNEFSENRLWDLTTNYIKSDDEKNKKCFICGYDHARRVCPLVKCHQCSNFGHSQQICPLKRITKRKK